MKIFNSIIFLSLLLGLASCSISDVTNLWPSGDSGDDEIVIREVPGDTFDPEDTEEITITVDTEQDNEEVLKELLASYPEDKKKLFKEKIPESMRL